MRSVLSDLYPEPGGDTAEVPMSTSLPSTTTSSISSAGRATSTTPRATSSTTRATSSTPRASSSQARATSSRVRATASVAGKPSVESKSSISSIIKTGVNVVSSLFGGTKRPGDNQSPKSASPKDGRRQTRTTQSRTTGGVKTKARPKPRRNVATTSSQTSATVSESTTPELTNSLEVLPASSGSEKAERPTEAGVQEHEQDIQQEPGENLDSEGRSIASESGSHTDTDITDVGDETDASIISEDFESSLEDDVQSQTGLSNPDSAWREREDDVAAESEHILNFKISKRVSFDESSPSTLMFTPDESENSRISDDDASHEGEEQVGRHIAEEGGVSANGNENFLQLLALLKEHSLIPTVQQLDESADSEPTSQVARFLRDLEHKRNSPETETELSDIGEDEVQIASKERRNAVPSAEAGGRRGSFADAIDEFLHYLQAIADDHKAHQEAMLLLDKADDSTTIDSMSDAASDGDSAWSEADSQPSTDVGAPASETDTISVSDSIETDVDSGLASSPRSPMSPVNLDHDPPLPKEQEVFIEHDSGTVHKPSEPAATADFVEPIEKVQPEQDHHELNPSALDMAERSTAVNNMSQKETHQGQLPPATQAIPAIQQSPEKDVVTNVGHNVDESGGRVDSSVQQEHASNGTDDEADKANKVPTGPWPTANHPAAEESAGFISDGDGFDSQPPSLEQVRDSDESSPLEQTSSSETIRAASDDERAASPERHGSDATTQPSSDAGAATDFGSAQKPPPSDAEPGTDPETVPQPSADAKSAVGSVLQPLADADATVGPGAVSQPPTKVERGGPLPAEERRGSSADQRTLRGLQESSLPAIAVEVLGSQSADSLGLRSGSMVDDSLLSVPSVDRQARSPGQVGSLELVSKSPGEVSQQPSKEASDSELPAHHEPVQSLASIVDVLLREHSDDDVAHAVPSGLGATNSLAAISGQLLTDRSPGEPANPPMSSGDDGDDDERVIKTIDMDHGASIGYITEETRQTTEEVGEAAEEAGGEIRETPEYTGEATQEAEASAHESEQTKGERAEEIENVAEEIQETTNDTKEMILSTTETADAAKEVTAKTEETVGEAGIVTEETGEATVQTKLIALETGNSANETAKVAEAAEDAKAETKEAPDVIGGTDEGTRKISEEMEEVVVETETVDDNGRGEQEATELPKEIEGIMGEGIEQTVEERRQTSGKNIIGMDETGEMGEEMEQTAAEVKVTDDSGQAGRDSATMLLAPEDDKPKSSVGDVSAIIGYSDVAQIEVLVTADHISSNASNSQSQTPVHTSDASDIDPLFSHSGRITDDDPKEEPNVGVQTSSAMEFGEEEGPLAGADMSHGTRTDDQYGVVRDRLQSEQVQELSDKHDTLQMGATDPTESSPADKSEAEQEGKTIGEVTDSSMLPATTKQYTRDEAVMSGTREPELVEAEQIMEKEDADRVGSAVDDTNELISTSSASSVFSNLQSEMSDYVTSSEHDYLENHRPADNQQFTSSDLADDLINTFPGQRIGTSIDDYNYAAKDNIGLSQHTENAKRLVWSLITMASGVVQRGSLSGSKYDFDNPDNEEGKNSVSNDVTIRDTSEIKEGENKYTLKQKYTSDMHEETESKQTEGSSLSMDELKELHSNAIHNIIHAALTEVLEIAQCLVHDVVKTSSQKSMDRSMRENSLDESDNRQQSQSLPKSSRNHDKIILKQDDAPLLPYTKLPSRNGSQKTQSASKVVQLGSSKDIAKSKAYSLGLLSHELTPNQDTLEDIRENLPEEDFDNIVPVPLLHNIANIAVAITQSVLNAASTIVEDEEISYRKDGVRQSISHFKERQRLGSKNNPTSHTPNMDDESELLLDDTSASEVPPEDEYELTPPSNEEQEADMPPPEENLDNEATVDTSRDLIVSPTENEDDTTGDVFPTAGASADMMIDNTNITPNDTTDIVGGDADTMPSDADMAANASVTNADTDAIAEATDSMVADVKIVADDTDPSAEGADITDADADTDVDVNTENVDNMGADVDDTADDANVMAGATGAVIPENDQAFSDPTNWSSPETADSLGSTEPQIEYQDYPTEPDVEEDREATEEPYEAAPTGSDTEPDDATGTMEEQSLGSTEESIVSGSFAGSGESVDAVDEGLDTSDATRIRYQMGEIADQAQNVVTADPITSEMLNREPEEGAVQVGTDVAGENGEVPEVNGVQTTGASDSILAHVPPPDPTSDADLSASQSAAESDPLDSAQGVTQSQAGMDDGVLVAVKDGDGSLDPVNRLSKYDQEADNPSSLMPPQSLRRQSSFVERDIVAPDLLAMKNSGKSIQDMEDFATTTAYNVKHINKPYDADASVEATLIGDLKNNDEESTLAAFEDEGEQETEESESTESTTGEETTESSSTSKETLKGDDDEPDPGKEASVFDWLRRISTQMDQMGITDQLKEKYGEDPQKDVILDNPRDDKQDTMTPGFNAKIALSDTGMHQEYSLDMEDTDRIRQSCTQTDVKDDWDRSPPSGRADRPGAARPRQTPCGNCPCCVAMKRVVSRGRTSIGRGGDERQPARKLNRSRRAFSSPARSVGDLLDDTSSMTASTGPASSQGGDDYQRRMRNPKRWLKEATDEFMRRECIRQVVLKNDLVSEGCVRTKVTRISRHPSSLSDCLASCRDTRVPPTQSLQMEISRGETMVGGRPINYQDVKIRTPRACRGPPPPPAAPRRRSSPGRVSSRAAAEGGSTTDPARRFIDNYLGKSLSGRSGRDAADCGREPKSRKKITIKTDCRTR